MEVQEGICKLCLKKCENFETIDENTKNALDLLLLKIDFTVTQEPVMCTNCAEMLTNCFNFKVTCLNTHDFIFSFVNKNKPKLDLEDVYLNKEVPGTGVSDDQDVCGFCMGLVKKCFAVSLDVDKDDGPLKEMIEQCLPELDLSIFEKPVICAPCHGSLESCFRFVKNYLIVQEKTKEYRETLDIDGKSQIELSSLLQFTMSNLTSEVGINSVNVIEVEKHPCEDGKNHAKSDIANGGDIVRLERMLFDVSEDISKGVKNKNERFTEIDNQKDNDEHQVTPKNMSVCGEETDKVSSSKKEEILFENNGARQEEENILNMEIQEFLLVRTRGFSRSEEVVALPRLEVGTGFSQSPKCLTPNREETPSKSYIDQSLIDKNVSKEEIYHCEYCSFQATYKYHLRSHLLVHFSDVTIYNCDSCSFQTKYIHHLKKHILVHKDLSDVTLYKCDSCSFQTKYKTNLYRHLAVDPLIAAVYKCDYCSFQTNYKLCLKNHSLLHKDPSEVAIYKCVSCSFQTKDIKAIKKHSPGHTLWRRVYKCDYCLYQTKHINDLKKHLLTHKDSSEMTLKESSERPIKASPKMTLYKCGSCSFQAKREETLERHMLKHNKRPPDVTMYKCKLCPFQSKINYDTKRHKLIHKKNVPM